LGSGHKRPIRAVITDQENNNKLNTTNQRKKRKLNKSEIKTTESITSSSSKPSLSKAATISVFSTNSNHNNMLSASVRKKRSSQWAQMDRIRKHQSMRSKKMNNRNKNKRTPPMLRKNKTESTLFDIAPPPMSRTQSMSAIQMDNNQNNDNERGQSLPIDTLQTVEQINRTQTTMSEDTSSSPIISNVSQTMSFADDMNADSNDDINDVNVGVFAGFNQLQQSQTQFRINNRQRINFGHDDIVHDEIDHVQMKVVNAMSGASWMNTKIDIGPIIADHLDPNPFIHPEIVSNNKRQFIIKQSPTCSIRETPNFNKINGETSTFANIAFGFGDQRLSGRLSFSEDFSNGILMNSADKYRNARNVIPETPDTCDGGNGASLIKSHFKKNVRNQILCNDGNVETKKRLSFSCSQ